MHTDVRWCELGAEVNADQECMYGHKYMHTNKQTNKYYVHVYTYMYIHIYTHRRRVV